MIAIIRNLIVVALMALELSGCLGSLISSSSPPKYFEISYPYESGNCVQSVREGLKIWPFSASAPYDRDEMMIIDPSQKVRFSPEYRWVTLPGTMISDILLRDFMRSRLFALIVSAGNPYESSWELGGHVFEFAWQQNGHSGRAVLDLMINLWTDMPRRRVILRKHYHFEGKPTTSNDSEAFAKEMTGLVQQLSNELQRDICAKLSKDSSSQDAG